MSGAPPRTSWGRTVFDRIYKDSTDPWNVRSSEYERTKYDATLAALPRPCFAAGLEIGCSIGVLTRRLADYCDTLLGLDIADAALAQARRTCADLGHVHFATAQVPQDWPDGTFDLIVLSEILYFLDSCDLDRLSNRVLGSLRAEGVVLVVNWTGETDTPTTGDDAAAHLIKSIAPYLAPTLQVQNVSYRIDRLQWASAF